MGHQHAAFVDENDIRLQFGSFFYTRPISLDPFFDSCFIALYGTALWFLGTPSEIMEDTADMVYMISNTEKRMNKLRNPRTCPEVCGIACFPRSFQQGFLQFSKIGAIKLGRSPRCLPGTNALFTLLAVCCFPPTHASAIYAKHSGYINRLVSFPKKRDGMLATLFQFLWASMRSHFLPPAQSMDINYAGVNSSKNNYHFCIRPPQPASDIDTADKENSEEIIRAGIREGSQKDGLPCLYKSCETCG
jgi:hypothetical protein